MSQKSVQELQKMIEDLEENVSALRRLVEQGFTDVGLSRNNWEKLMRTYPIKKNAG
jgi:hypothetical protein